METETDKTETVEPQSPWPGGHSGSDRTGSRSGRSGGSGGASGGGSGDGGAARAVIGTLCTAGCRGASGRSDGGGTSRFTVSGTALARVLARAFGGVDSGGARARSARTAPLHTTVDAGAPPAAGAVPGLMRRRARVGGCSEAWRELYVRLDTKSAPWSDDNGPRLVFGWRWSEGVLPHHPVPERTTGRSVPVGSGHHCESPHPRARTLRSFRARVPCVPRSDGSDDSRQTRPKTIKDGSLRQYTINANMPQHFWSRYTNSKAVLILSPRECNCSALPLWGTSSARKVGNLLPACDCRLY